MTFDSKRALEEFAMPTYKAIPESMKKIHRRINEHFEKLPCGDDGNLPETPRDIEISLCKVEPELLCHANQALYFFGYCQGMDAPLWKTTAVVDRHLACRADISPEEVVEGWSILVQTGFLQLTCTRQNSSRFLGVACYATPTRYQECLSGLTQVYGQSEDPKEVFDDAVSKIALTESEAGWLNVYDRFTK